MAGGDRKSRTSPDEPTGLSCPVAGVGASAGGLESFSRLLKALTARPGMAIVLIQHLDPTHESVLAEILQRVSKMPVTEATNGMPVERDHVYVMPPNVTIELVGGALELSPRAPSPAESLPIDRFFRSLARECKSGAIGIVLSGTGEDGSRGLEAIKEANGLTFAQDPLSADYDGMPRAAIKAGSADRVLEPEGIADQLARLGRLMGEGAPGRVPVQAGDLDEESLTGILELVRSSSGLELSHYRRTTLLRRISRRMLLGGFGTLAEYLAALRGNQTEVERLYRDILINVTEFFRDPNALGVLRREAYPEILERKGPDAAFRVWVPGCSKGQEAYSIVMSLIEFIEEAGVPATVQMFATDVNDIDIKFARAAVYPESMMKGVSEERLGRFFTPVPGGFRVNQSVREMCVFAVHDVTKDPPFSKLDIVSFRNVLIYMERPLQKRVLEILHYSLVPGGFLLLGSAETVGSALTLFSPVDEKRRLYLRKPGPARLIPAHATSSSLSTERTAEAGTVTPFDIMFEADKVVADRYAPPGILVNATLDIVQFRGDVTPFLDPSEGPPDFTLSRMVAAGVATSAQAAILESAKTGEPSRRVGFVTGAEGARTDVDVSVVPMSSPSEEIYYLILLEARPIANARPLESAAKPGAATARPGEVEALARELDETRKYVEAVVAEKEAANNELRIAGQKLQAGNEELRTINEEFQTAQEELQSTNEELTTLNDELRNRNAELGHLTDDLDNVIQGVEIPILILGPDLRIHRFTPQTERIIRIVPTDVGRPVTDLSLKVQVDDFQGLVEHVIRSHQPSQTDVQDASGRWYSMRIRPYKTSADAYDGAVVAFIDVDVMKRSMQLAEIAREHAQAVIATVSEPLLTLGPTLRVLEANAAYYREFRVDAEETIGSLVYELGDGQWDTPELRALLEEVLPRDSEFAEFEVERDFPKIGRRVMVLSGRRVQEEQNQPSILLAIDDVTLSRAQARVSGALNDISAKIGSTFDLDESLADVLVDASGVIRAESGLILMRQDGGWQARATFGTGQPAVGELVDEAKLPPGILAAARGETPQPLTEAEEATGALGPGAAADGSIAVPLMSRRRVVGALSFRRAPADGDFSDIDVDFARRLGALLSLAFENSRLYSSQRAIADTLQTALLTVPRRIPGIDFGYLYRSATEAASVGGDLYDLFQLSDTSVGVLIGDVSGKGVEAATLAGLVKNTIRALSYQDDSPADVLAKANDVLLRATPTSIFVTLLFCVLDTVSGELTYCSAGHTHGIVRKSDGAAELFDVGSPILGGFSSSEYVSGQTSLAQGDVLVLYTDGVTEARRNKDLLGEERLTDIVRALNEVPARKVPDAIFAEVMEFTGGRLSDDVAIIAVGRS